MMHLLLSAAPCELIPCPAVCEGLQPTRPIRMERTTTGGKAMRVYAPGADAPQALAPSCGAQTSQTLSVVETLHNQSRLSEALPLEVLPMLHNMSSRFVQFRRGSVTGSCIEHTLGHRRAAWYIGWPPRFEHLQGLWVDPIR